MGWAFRVPSFFVLICRVSWRTKTKPCLLPSRNWSKESPKTNSRRSKLNSKFWTTFGTWTSCAWLVLPWNRVSPWWWNSARMAQWWMCSRGRTLRLAGTDSSLCSSTPSMASSACTRTRRNYCTGASDWLTNWEELDWNSFCYGVCFSFRIVLVLIFIFGRLSHLIGIWKRWISWSPRMKSINCKFAWLTSAWHRRTLTRSPVRRWIICLSFSQVSLADVLKEMQGTPFYMPPEMTVGAKYSIYSDVCMFSWMTFVWLWIFVFSSDAYTVDSLAIIIWEMAYRVCCGKYSVPYTDEEFSGPLGAFTLMMRVGQGLRPQLPDTIPVGLVKIIEKAWDADPNGRYVWYALRLRTWLSRLCSVIYS